MHGVQHVVELNSFQHYLSGDLQYHNTVPGGSDL